MKFNLFLVGVFLFSFWSMAEDRRIIKIFNNNEFLENHVTLFLDDGEIVHFDENNLDLVAQAKAAMKSNFYISFKRLTDNLQQSDLITDIKLENPAEPETSNRFSVDKEMHNPTRFNSIRWNSKDPLEKSNITKLRDYDHAQDVMNTFNGKTHDDSQCYNRAHMWTYEALVEKKVNLGKLWIFFTRKYIREYNYKWWFHTTPYAEVGEEGFKYALDRGFFQIPYAIENWKNYFIKNKAQCPVVKNYSDHENNQESAYCYFMYTSQYYWQPWQIERLSKFGEHRYGYKMNELRITFKDALRRRWNGRIPELTHVIPNPEIDGPTNPEPEPRVPRTEPEPRPEPRPSTPDRPRRNPDRDRYIDRDLRMNETVIDIARGDVRAKVLDHQVNGQYYIQYLEGPQRGRTSSNRSRRDFAIQDGCYKTVCVGESMYTITREVDAVKVMAIQADGRFVVQFERGGHRGHHWGFDYLAKRTGCGREFCVGDEAYNRAYANTRVRIIGIQPNGYYILHFLTGPYAGRYGENWHPSHLLRIRR